MLSPHGRGQGQEDLCCPAETSPRGHLSPEGDNEIPSGALKSFALPSCPWSVSDKVVFATENPLKAERAPSTGCCRANRSSIFSHCN